MPAGEAAGVLVPMPAIQAAAHDDGVVRVDFFTDRAGTASVDRPFFRRTSAIASAVRTVDPFVVP